MAENKVKELGFKDTNNVRTTKKFYFDWEIIEKFTDEYDYWGDLGWFSALLNEDIDIEVMRECIKKHSEGTLESPLPDNAFIKDNWVKV